MKLVFLYQPVTDLDEAVAFHRDVLGLDEAWREDDDTVPFFVPDKSAQIMLSTDPKPAGPMYLVGDAAGWIAEHADIPVRVPAFEIPGGIVAGLEAPGGNVFYVFDQDDA